MRRAAQFAHSSQTIVSFGAPSPEQCERGNGLRATHMPMLISMPEKLILHTIFPHESNEVDEKELPFVGSNFGCYCFKRRRTHTQMRAFLRSKVSSQVDECVGCWYIRQFCEFLFSPKFSFSISFALTLSQFSRSLAARSVAGGLKRKKNPNDSKTTRRGGNQI